MTNKAQGPKETAAERAYADIGADRAELAQQMRPIRADLFRRVSDFRQRGQQMRDLSASDIALAKQPVLQAGRAGGGAALQRLGLSSSSADQAASTERRTASAHAASLGGLASMAVGEQGNAIAGMGELARDAQSEAIARARRDAASAALRADTVGAAGGLVAGGLVPLKSGGEDQNDFKLGGKYGAATGTDDDPNGLGAVTYRGL